MLLLQAFASWDFWHEENKYFINVDVYKNRYSIENLNIYIYKNDKEIIRIIIGDQFRYE